MPNTVREEPPVPAAAFTMEDIYKDACRAVEEALVRTRGSDNPWSFGRAAK